MFIIKFISNVIFKKTTNSNLTKNILPVFLFVFIIIVYSFDAFIYIDNYTWYIHVL